MSGGVKEKARQFVRSCPAGCTSAQAVKDALARQGYTVVPFNGVCDEAPTATILRSLRLQEYARTGKGFTYADGSYRLVFVHEDLSDREQLLVLLHEQGHILCGHMGATAIMGQDVLQEHEANEFAHHVLHPGPLFRFSQWSRRHKKALIAAVVSILVLCIAVGTCVGLHVHKRNAETFYITNTGSKYHERDCIYVKNKSDVTAMSRQELEEQGYTPCDVCHPTR